MRVSGSFGSAGLNDEIFTKGKIRPLASLHILRRSLRKRRDQDGQGNSRIARDVSCVSTARKFAVDQTLVKGNCVGSAARVWGVGGDLDGVFMPVMMLFV